MQFGRQCIDPPDALDSSDSLLPFFKTGDGVVEFSSLVCGVLRRDWYLWHDCFSRFQLTPGCPADWSSEERLVSHWIPSRWSIGERHKLDQLSRQIALQHVMVDPQSHAVVQFAAKITKHHNVFLGMSQDRFQLVHLYTPPLFTQQCVSSQDFILWYTLLLLLKAISLIRKCNFKSQGPSDSSLDMRGPRVDCQTQ